MDQETPGLQDLIDELMTQCYTHTVITLNADTFEEPDFVAVRAENGVVLFGNTIDEPTRSSDLATRETFLNWIITYPYVIMIVRSYLIDTDPITHNQKAEIRGYLVKYQDGKITYERMPKDDLERCRSIDPQTGQHKEPDSDEIYL